MSNTPFKVPQTPNPRSLEDENDICTPATSSDSEESTASSDQDFLNKKISIVAEFDDLMRAFKRLNAAKVNKIFLDYTEQVQLLINEWITAVNESKRLQNVLDLKTHECSDLESKLSKARKLLDQEKSNTRNALRERDEMALQINQIRELLIKDGVTAKIPEETRNKLSFLNNESWENGIGAPLSAIREIDSTGSILSEFSYSRSEDDLDGSLLQGGKTWKKHRPSTGGVPEPAVKKRKSSEHKTVEINTTDTVRATTTLTVSKTGPIRATSIIESVPKNDLIEPTPTAPPPNLVFESWAKGSAHKARNSPFLGERNCHQHNFQQRGVIIPFNCDFCGERIRFGKSYVKCKECGSSCHNECKDLVPLPCIPLVNTPNQRNALGVIGDYTPTIPPMVPALLVHCINEIELRGLNEIGIYRIPGSEKDVKSLKEKFLRGKGTPCLNQVDIHVLCGTVKDFLRSLNESILTYALWKRFVKAVDAKDCSDIPQALYQVISELPQPNRDTLAYIIVHLQKISEASECKMPIGNLAKIFGPTIVGYSSDDPDPNHILSETAQQVLVMEHLMRLPSNYWSSFIDIVSLQPGRLQQTPSTDSLLRTTTLNKNFFTPNRSMVKRKQKFFATPPTLK